MTKILELYAELAFNEAAKDNNYIDSLETDAECIHYARVTLDAMRQKLTRIMDSRTMSEKLFGAKHLHNEYAMQIGIHLLRIERAASRLKPQDRIELWAHVEKTLALFNKSI